MYSLLTELVTEAVVGPNGTFESKSFPSGPLNVVTVKNKHYTHYTFRLLLSHHQEL
jgi:hypothetical protein